MATKTTDITTALATPDRWDDVQHALTGGGDGASCQCAWPMLINKEWESTTRDEREHLLHGEITAGPAPGLVAYADGDPAGWIRIGPRPLQKRLARTRLIAAATDEPFDDASVWAVSCFVVRREHRGKGINAVLLDAAVAYARASGARVIEGYPVDTARTTTSANNLFHGALSTFLAAGFTTRPSVKPERPLAVLRLP
ncbi:GNAT family N-acetyltransferase [Microbacterium sp. NPDC055903]